MLKALGTIMLGLGVAAAAHAGVAVLAAPEIDPASALGALTLLGGALAVIGGRRSKKK